MEEYFGVVPCTLMSMSSNKLNPAACETDIVGALAIIESFAPKSSKRFEVHVKVEKGADKLRPKVEAVFAQFRVDFELRTTAEETLSYEVQVPFETDVERVTDSLLLLHSAVAPIAARWSGPARCGEAN